MGARFKVEITGSGLERARGTLNRAGIPTLGPTLNWLDGSRVVIGHEMAAVLDAETAEAAGERVKEVLVDEKWSVGAVGHS